MAENRAITNESEILMDDFISSTDDVAERAEIEVVPCRIGERNDEEWEIITGTEVLEENEDDEESCEQDSIEIRDLITRSGPRVRDYLAEFFTCVRRRFGMRQNNFVAPIQLQTTLEQMETSRVPVSIWRAFLNASMNFLSRIGVGLDKYTLIDLLIFILTIISEFFINNIILQIVVLILGCLGAKQLTAIITTIYQLIKSSFDRFWAYVKRKLLLFCKLSAEHYKEYRHP